MVCESYPRNVLVFLLLAACELEDPCPRGARPSGGRCLSPESTDGEAVEASDGSVPHDGLDDAELPDPSMDASTIEPDLMEAGDNEEPLPEDDADTDESAESAVTAPECADDARDAWRRFQMSEGAVPAILACYQADDSLCGSGACDLAGCLLSTAQIDGCDRCVAAEVACSTEHCSVPCSVPTNDDACRACACANGCLDPPQGCGYGSLDACADCAGASCSARLASITETITVPIFFHLLHDRSDPAMGIPAYATGDGQHETILAIDAVLAQVNDLLDAARPDTRRLRVVRAGVTYLPAPAAGSCPDPVATSDAYRLYGALNVVLTGGTTSCPAAATSAFAGRASGATLLRVLGNMLGIAPDQQQGEPWQITHPQWVRMHNYARWRLGAARAVPEAEKGTSTSFVHGPADPIWDKLTNRDWALNNASLFDATSTRPFSSLPVVETFSVPETTASRRVLGVRVSAKISGVPSDDLRVSVGPPRRTPPPLPRSAVWIGDGKLVAEDAFDTSTNLERLRNFYAGGLWRVTIHDSANLVIEDVRLELVLGDRAFTNYDRHGRGVMDILVYRASSSELLTATNADNGTIAFGAIVSDRVPPLPVANAKVMSGDVNGDGRVDLLARDGSTIWVTFYEDGFREWRAGSIAGSDGPSRSDDVLMGDFDGDGFGDLMRRRPNPAMNRSLWTYHRGFGDGTFEAARAPYFETFEGIAYLPDVNWTVADILRMGRSELVLRHNQSGGYIFIASNITPRPTTSGATIQYYGGWNPTIDGGYSAFLATDRFIVVDANQDGCGDFVARRPGSGEWLIHRNDGASDIWYGPEQHLTIGGSTTAFGAGDALLGAAP